MDIEVNFSKAEKSFAAEVSTAERSHEVNADGDLVFYVPQLNAYLKKEEAEKYYQPKGEYLESSELEGAINDALREAKESGEFDGKDGDDGISPTVTVSKSGKVTTVKITDKDGTKTATINDGSDGRTPEKGVDYGTPEDIAEMVAATVAALPKYNGEVIEL